MGTEKTFDSVAKTVIGAIIVAFLFFIAQKSIIIMNAAETIEDACTTSKAAKRSADSSIFYSRILIERVDRFETFANQRLTNIENNLIIISKTK